MPEYRHKKQYSGIKKPRNILVPRLAAGSKLNPNVIGSPLNLHFMLIHE